MRTLLDVASRLREERVDLSKGYLLLLRVAANNFARANGPVPLSDLSDGLVRCLMRALADKGRSAETVNNNRRAILYLWETARAFAQSSPGAGWECPACPRGDVRKLKEVIRVPTAWKPGQFAAIVSACRGARTRRGWGPPHWLALAFTIYDTSLRIGCLLDSMLSQLDKAEHRLWVPGELQKGRCDTCQPIHRETLRMLVMMPRPSGDKRLFPWPFARRAIWKKFESEILIPAGLPAGRRDKFHRIRRTSYSHVASKFGIAAASEHAAHKEDLSKRYLDPTFLDRPNPLDALPRPA